MRFASLVRGLVGAGLIGGAAVAGANLVIRAVAAGGLRRVADVPHAPAAVILGAKVHPDGRPSEFLRARLDLGLRLLRAGRTDTLVVSGDGVEPGYDEPGVMRDYLIAAGVPAGVIVVDRAGLDTYDSCLRARRLLGLTEVILVSQTYHLPRAIGIARLLGLSAYGVGDDSVRRFRRPWAIGVIREQLSYVKAARDLLSRRDPAVSAR